MQSSQNGKDFNYFGHDRQKSLFLMKPLKVNIKFFGLVLLISFYDLIELYVNQLKKVKKIVKKTKKLNMKNKHKQERKIERKMYI